MLCTLSHLFYPFFDYVSMILAIIPDYCSILVVAVILDFNLFYMDQFTIAFIMNVLIPFIIAIISLFQLIAIARFADTKNFKSSFNLKEIINDIKNIGWKRYVVFIICLYLIYFVISFFKAFLIAFLLILQIIFMYLIFYPYLIFISSRAVGLIYNESKI